MPFKVGERVKYLNHIGGGVIVRVIDSQLVEIKDDDGFDFIVKKNELVSEGKSALNHNEIKERLKSFSHNEAKQIKNMDSSQNLKNSMVDYLQSSRKSWTNKDKDFIEVDLHIEELVEKPKLLNDGQKLILQLEHARFCLDEVMNIKMRRLIFIHGVGSGVLRHELRSWLKTLSYVEVINADFRRYGIGATEVRIKGNN